jgi:glyoxylase-like metal-dependent hydrolase (beta-lactamase superfamily II)
VRTLGSERWTYEKGLHELGNGCYAWLAPDGSWGWSNAGLVVDGGASLLVDTLFDLPLTREMLAAMRAAEPRAAAHIDVLVNTHSNGDHCFGNELVAGAEIVASRACAEEMAREGPERLARFKALAPGLGELGEYFLRTLGRFEFDGIRMTLPTRTFDGRLELEIGARRVELIEVGPAHTAGDAIAWLPEQRVVFTGDILFVDGTPIVWQGPVSNWIRACELLLGLDAEAIVPGHGPITDRRGPAAVKAYLEYVSGEARARYDAGLGAAEAARDIALGDYDSWGDAERIAVNVAALYREFAGDPSPPDVPALFAEMAQIDRERRR